MIERLMEAARQLDEAIAMIEKARAEGLEITADIYTYEAGSTGLKSCMPPWVERPRRVWVVIGPRQAEHFLMRLRYTVTPDRSRSRT